MSHEKNNAGSGADPVLPRAKRSKRLVAVKCKREIGSEVSIRIHDASNTGMRGDCAEVADFREGEAVLLQFRNLAPIAATIARHENREVALTFGRELDIDHVLRTHLTPDLPEPSPRAETTREWIDSARRQAVLPAPGKRPL
jgi:hypothetical protein